MVNEAMNRTEDLLRELYKGINVQLAASIENRKDSISDQLALYTDSLIKLRVKYNIYDLLSRVAAILFKVPRKEVVKCMLRVSKKFRILKR